MHVPVGSDCCELIMYVLTCCERMLPMYIHLNVLLSWSGAL